MADFPFNPLFDAPDQSRQATAATAPPPRFAPNPLFDDPTGSRVASDAREGKSWEDVAGTLGDRPDKDQLQQQFRLEKRRAYESQRSETAQEFVATRSLLFASAIGNTAREIRYKRVMDQIAAGKSPSDDDIEFVARHEHLAQFKAERMATLPGALAETVAGIPALIGEAAVARAGSAAVLGAERVAKLGIAGRAGLSVAETPAMPSLYAEQAAQRATQQGGEATDLKNLAPPLAMAALQNVVLGRLQGRAATSTVPTAAGRLAYAGAIGVGEQAAVDVGASAVDEVLDPAYKTRTRYGVLGDLARGDIGKASTHATVQALTFAAFASMHGRAADPAETVGPAFDSLAKKGLSREKAGEVVNDAVAGKVEPPTEAVKAHVETMEEAGRWPGDLPGRAERDKALADAQEAAKTGKPAVYVDMDIDNLKGLDKAVGSDSARMHVKDFVEIVKSELADTGAEVKVFRHSGDPQGDEHSAVVVGADKRAVDAALRSAQTKIAEFTQAKGLADIPHSKGDRPPGVGVTAFAEPIEPGKPWKTAVSEAEAGTETLKARKVAEPPEPADPLAGIPDADVKALAKQLGLTPKGLRDRADQPGVRDLIAAVRGKPPEVAPESEDAKQARLILAEAERDPKGYLERVGRIPWNRRRAAAEVALSEGATDEAARAAGDKEHEAGRAAVREYHEPGVRRAATLQAGKVRAEEAAVREAIAHAQGGRPAESARGKKLAAQLAAEIESGADPLPAARREADWLAASAKSLDRLARWETAAVSEFLGETRGKSVPKASESPEVSSQTQVAGARAESSPADLLAQAKQEGVSDQDLAAQARAELARRGLPPEPENAINAPPRAPEPGVASGPSEPPIVDSGASGRVARAPKELSDREQAVLDGLAVEGEDKGGQRVADSLGISRERVRQIKNAALEKLGKTLEEYKAEAAEARRNRALDLIEQRQQRNPETNQPIRGVDLGELRNLPPKEADRALAVREGERSRDIANEDFHAKKITTLLKEIDRAGGFDKLSADRREAVTRELAELQQREESRSRPPRKQPKGRKAAGAGAEPVAEGGAEARPGGRPAVPAPGAEGGVQEAGAADSAGGGGRAVAPDLAGKPVPGRPGDAGAAPPKLTPSNTLAREVMKSGGIDPESHALLAIFGSIKEARAHGLNTPGLFKKGGLGLDVLAQELHSRDVIPDAEPETLVRLLQGKADVPWHDASKKIEAALAAHEKAQQEQADAEQKALRSGHSATSAEEAIRRGQEDGEAEARAEAEANRTDEPADAVPSFDPAEFGRPLTAEERRTTDLGGGQENAGDAQRAIHETALANARVDAERVKNGLPPLMAAARRANPEVWDQAMAKLAADPNVSARLVEELAASGRATTVDENALLLHRKIALNNEYERTMRQAAAAMLAKNLPEFDRLSGRSDELLGQIDRLDKVTRSTGTEWGRAGQFRRQLALEDFSLSRMMLEAERAKREPLTTEEKADIAKMAERIKELEAQLAALKDTGGKTPDGKDETDVEIEIDKQKRRHRERIEDFNRGHRPLHQKVIAGGLETANVVRTFITAYDLSAVLRQGAMLSYAHPVKAARAVPDMLKSFLSSHHFDRAEKLIRNRPNGTLYEKAGLYLSDQLSHPEEAFLGRWVKRIPGVAASERAYSGFLNRMRADVFDSLVAALPRDGKPTPAEAKALANYVNVSTGRGKLPGSFEKAADALSQVFFSPRYLASRFQVLAGQPFYGGTARTRKLVAQEYARSLAGLGVFYAVAKALMPDSEVDFDPRSSDFGKVKVGRFRVDPLTGFSQLVTFGARLTSGETKSTENGRVSALRGPKHEFGDTSTGDVVMRFLRNKLAPVPGSVYDVLSGTMPGGQPTTKERLAGQFIPISIRDVYEAMTADQGVPRGMALSLLAILGMGTQNYEVRDKKTTKQEPVLPVFPSGQVQPRRRPAGVR